MNFQIGGKKLSLLLLASLLGACSNSKIQTNMNELQRNFDTYQYSSYVKANLKAESVVETKRNITNANQTTLAKRRLSNSKKQSTNKISNTVNNNGLYKPSKQGNEVILTSLAGLDNVLTLALENNLEILTAKQQVTASLAKYDQVGFLDDMLNQYAAFTDTKKSVQFPSPGLLSLKSSIIDQSIETQRLRLMQKIQDVITQTRLTYHELQFIKAETLLINQDISLSKSLKKELQNNYASNTGDLDGVLQVDIDLATSRNTLQTIKDRYNSQQVRLNSLLNRSPDLKIGKLDKIQSHKFDLNSDSSTTIKQAQLNRVEIAILLSELAQMEKVIQLSQKRFYPDLDSGFSRLKNGQFSTKAKIKKNKVLAKDDAYLTETREKVIALKSKIAALKTKTADDVQQLVSKHHISKKTVNLYENTVIPKAKVSLEIANNQYETGETNYANVIKTNKKLLKYRFELLNRQKQKVTNKILLERLISKM